MTTDMRDGVQWKPWWVRYAEFEGRILRLADVHVLREHMEPLHPGARTDARWCVGLGPEPCKRPEACLNNHAPHARDLWNGNDLDEALAAFYAAEEKLLRGEL